MPYLRAACGPRKSGRGSGRAGGCPHSSRGRGAPPAARRSAPPPPGGCGPPRRRSPPRRRPRTALRRPREARRGRAAGRSGAAGWEGGWGAGPTAPQRSAEALPPPGPAARDRAHPAGPLPRLSLRAGGAPGSVAGTAAAIPRALRPRGDSAAAAENGEGVHGDPHGRAPAPPHGECRRQSAPLPYLFSGLTPSCHALPPPTHQPGRCQRALTPPRTPRPGWALWLGDGVMPGAISAPLSHAEPHNPPRALLPRPTEGTWARRGSRGCIPQQSLLFTLSTIAMRSPTAALR